MSLWLITALLIGLGLVGWYVRKAGADSVRAQQGTQDAKASAAITDALSKSPTSDEQLTQRLHNGGKL